MAAYIDATPTWADLLPMLLAAGGAERMAPELREEFERMAAAADKWNAHAGPLVEALDECRDRLSVLIECDNEDHGGAGEDDIKAHKAATAALKGVTNG